LAFKSWRKEHPKLAKWAQEAAPESLTVFDFPAAHRIRLRTTNGLERINRELRRRTRLASIFPNPDSCLRLVCALLAELDDESDPQDLSQLQPVTQSSCHRPGKFTEKLLHYPLMMPESACFQRLGVDMLLVYNQAARQRSGMVDVPMSC